MYNIDENNCTSHVQTATYIIKKYLKTNCKQRSKSFQLKNDWAFRGPVDEPDQCFTELSWIDRFYTV